MDPLELQLQHLQKFGVIDKDQIQLDAQERQVPKAKKNERKRVEIQVDWEIDLHECTLAEAEAQISEAIEMAQKANMKKLRIVHGGRIGQYGPVAKLVQRLLRSTHRRAVRRFEYDGLNDGATLVELV